MSQNPATVAHPAKFTDAKAALGYAFAGQAALSAVSKKTGNRITFRFTKAPKNPQYDFDCWWVNLDSTTEKPYIGSFDADFKFWPDHKLGDISKAAAGGPDVEAARGVEWLVRHLAAGVLPEDKVEVWHAGTCGRCGCELTTVDSITRGLGPVCAVKLGVITLPARKAKAVA